jgi:hypothetical protein
MSRVRVDEKAVRFGPEVGMILLASVREAVMDRFEAPDTDETPSRRAS